MKNNLETPPEHPDYLLATYTLKKLTKYFDGQTIHVSNLKGLKNLDYVLLKGDLDRLFKILKIREEIVG